MIDLKLVTEHETYPTLGNGDASSTFNTAPAGTMDLFFDGNDFAVQETLEEVTQRVRTRLYSIYGEWVFDPRLGLPTFDVGGVHDDSTPLIKRTAMIRRYIGTTRGVNQITKFDVVVDTENKAIRVAFEANTVFGALEIEETITV